MSLKCLNEQGFTCKAEERTHLSRERSLTRCSRHGLGEKAKVWQSKTQVWVLALLLSSLQFIKLKMCSLKTTFLKFIIAKFISGGGVSHIIYRWGQQNPHFFFCKWLGASSNHWSLCIPSEDPLDNITTVPVDLI